MAVVRVPLALFDHYLGRLIIQADAPAQVERYLSTPLLTLSDISTFMTRQIGGVAPTPRLVQLDLLNEVPELATLLTQVATGALVLDDATTVSLTPVGQWQLRRCRTKDTLPLVDAAHGSPGDPSDASDGSRHGSTHVTHHVAFSSSKMAPAHSDHRAWDIHGKKKQNKDSRTHKLSHDAHSAAEEQCNERAVVRQSEPTTRPKSSETLSSKSTHIAATSDIFHRTDIDLQIVTAHQLLNVDRAISEAEWWALGQMQQENGAFEVLRWQRRAIAAGRTRVTLHYYQACAAAAACDTACGRDTAAVAPLAQHVEQIPQRSTALPLSDEHRAVIARIAERAGTPVRYPEKLAAAPLPLLQRWCAIAAHPGLHVKGDPVALLVHGASQGKEPPTIAELNRWAEQRGVHWSQLATWQPAQEQLKSARPSHTYTSVIATQPSLEHAPPLVGDLEAALRSQLRLMRPRAMWPLIDDLRVCSVGDHVMLSWDTPQQLAQAQALLIDCLRSALDDLGERRPFQIAIAERIAPVPLHTQGATP